jgi:hypothetical protein
VSDSAAVVGSLRESLQPLRERPLRTVAQWAADVVFGVALLVMQPVHIIAAVEHSGVDSADDLGEIRMAEFGTWTLPDIDRETEIVARLASFVVAGTLCWAILLAVGATPRNTGWMGLQFFAVSTDLAKAVFLMLEDR